MDPTDGLTGYRPPLLRTAALDRSSPVPLWRQVELDLERRVRTDEFKSAFPGELELAELYAVSRHTIRQALRALRDSGTVQAGRGRSSSVAQASVRAGGVTGALLTSASNNSGCIVRSVAETADGTVSARLGLEESTPLVLVDRVHVLDDEPLAWDRAWIPAGLARPLLAVDFGAANLERELMTQCRVQLSGGRELVRATVPSSAAERILCTTPGEAVIDISCTGEMSGQPVLWRSVLVRGSRFSLLTTRVGTEPATTSVSIAEQPARDPYAWRPGSALFPNALASHIQDGLR